MTFTPPRPEVTRDRWGRPMVVPIAGGKPVAYTRCTTYVDCLEDKYNLQKWHQRMVAIGLSQRPDLLLSASAHRDDKRELDRVCEQAREAATASAAATTGTAIHSLTETLDRGEELPVVPEATMRDLDAYRDATRDLTAVAIEQFLVQDALQVAGTCDRVVKYQGQRYIADIKTGSIEWGSLKIAMQLAMYAHSRPYDLETAGRGDHEADIKRGIIIHLPAGTGTCTLYWVDLKQGWDNVLIARRVRDARRLKMPDLTEAFGQQSADGATPDTVTSAAAEPATPEQPDLAQLIDLCGDADSIRALWTQHAAEWNDDLTEQARGRIAALAAS